MLSDRAPAATVGWREMLEDGRRVSDAALRERARAVDPEQSAFVFYTSGTTGFPKGAVHGHRIIRNTWDHGERMGVTVDDVILMYLPLFHIFGFIHGALMSLIRGARQVLTETFDGDECVELIAREKATMIHGFDTHFQALLDAQGKNPARRVERPHRHLRHGHGQRHPGRAPGPPDVRQPHDRPTG